MTNNTQNAKNVKNIYSLNSPVIDGAIDRVVIKLYREKKKNKSRIFMVCGCEPAVGSTSIAINLAIAVAAAGWKTILIDADMRKESKYKRLTETEIGLTECLSGMATDPNNVFNLTNHPRLHYLASGNPKINPINFFGSAQTSKFFEALRTCYDFIIIDAPSPLAAVDSTLIGGLSDSTILVAKWEHTTKQSIHSSKTLLEDAGANILGIVLNYVDNKSFVRINKAHKYFIDKEYKNNNMFKVKRVLDKKNKQTDEGKNTYTRGTR